MKKITFLRHAKSSWEANVSDKDRPLTPKGIKAIEAVAIQWSSLFSSAQCIFSSPAKRAVHTTTILANSIGFSKKNILFKEELYTFGPYDLIKFVDQLDNKLKEVILVGHNPAFSIVSQALSKDSIPELTTTGWVQLTFKGSKWSKIASGKSIFGSRKSVNIS